MLFTQSSLELLYETCCHRPHGNHEHHAIFVHNNQAFVMNGIVRSELNCIKVQYSSEDVTEITKVPQKCQDKNDNFRFLQHVPCACQYVTPQSSWERHHLSNFLQQGEYHLYDKLCRLYPEFAVHHRITALRPLFCNIGADKILILIRIRHML